MEFSKCKWTPFTGMAVYGSVRRVTLRGEVVFVDGKILAKPGSGKNIATLRQTNCSNKFKVPISKIPEILSEPNSPKKPLQQKLVTLSQSGDSHLLIPNRVRAISTSTQNG